jgi:PAS domain-containing protein
VSNGQRAIELIQARTLLSKLSTPGFLVDEVGQLIYFNDAAGELLGVPFAEAGAMGSDEWGTRFGPFTTDGRHIPVDELPLTIALRRGRSAHSRLVIRSDQGVEHEIEVTAFPVITGDVQRGAIAIFWPATAD